MAGKKSDRPDVFVGQVDGTKSRTASGFSLRQLKYRTNRLNGMTRYDAAFNAGYSARYAGDAAFRNEKIFGNDIQRALIKAGATDEVISSRIVKKFDAKKTTNASILLLQNGETVKAEEQGLIEVDDNATQMKALELACELKGHLKRGGSGVNVQVIEPTKFTIILDGDSDAGSSGKVNAEADSSVQAVDVA